ncbi:conserved exported hypothetical protein [Verrucomicrobia bacterium]|nr:conserved exported hypothetical protein [Verrucomicrobiota bacterium]
MIMAKLNAFLLALASWALLPGAAPAQLTNGYPFVPQTRLEAFETNTGSVVLKTTTQMGLISANGGALAVRCRQITDSGSGRTEYGLVFILGEAVEDILLLDYDEIDSLLNAIDVFLNIDWSITSMNSFDASYTSKGGLRISAYSLRRSGVIEFSVRSLRSTHPPLPLFRDQVSQVRQFIAQGKTKLDSLRK